MLTPYVWICMCSCETVCGRLFSDRSNAATIVATGIHGPCWAWGGAPRAERETIRGSRCVVGAAARCGARSATACVLRITNGSRVL